MELNIRETDNTQINEKHVSFNDDNNTQLNIPNSRNVGSFQTINRQKPMRTTVPLDTSVYNQKPFPQPAKKKNISYDDILSSMGMVLGPDGKLQMFNKNVAQQAQQSQQFPPQYQKQQHQQMPRQQQQYQQMPRQQQYQEQYQEEQEQPQYPPLTKKQYKQLIVLDMIKKQNEQRRLSQIKSTKLLFPNPNVQIASMPSGANMNRLFKFVGK